MLFSSLIFLFAFLPVFILLYFMIPGNTGRNIVLLIASLIFYSWGEPVYILLMVFSIVVNWLLGLLIEWEPKKKTQTLVFAVILNLFILGFFKYYGFVITTVNDIFGTSFYIHELDLPIGISFYTFQTLSYIIDLYRGKFRAQKSLLKFAVYISMFFQLIAGPIVRYEDVEKQLTTRKTSTVLLGKGIALFVFGLGKKVLLANQIGSLFDTTALLGQNVSGLTVWLKEIAYTFQIYFDFSGYSDMAVGLGAICGFRFPENFHMPYLSTSVTMFWRRWHISLGTWFREYVYIPLGGNRVKPWRHVLNIMIVWLLTGLWHGASWNFVLWGLYYGLILLFEIYVLFRWKKMPAFLGFLWTIILVILGWVIFSSGSISEIFMNFSAMFGGAANGLCDAAALGYLKTYAVILALCLFACMPFAPKLKEGILEHPVLLVITTVVIFGLCTAFLAADTYNPFLYFRF